MVRVGPGTSRVRRCREEEARGSRGETVWRRVLRLTGYGVTLTQIVASRRDTCMLLRTRPGWGTLRGFLLCTGQEDQKKWGLCPSHRQPCYRAVLATPQGLCCLPSCRLLGGHDSVPSRREEKWV